MSDSIECFSCGAVPCNDPGKTKVYCHACHSTNSPEVLDLVEAAKKAEAFLTCLPCKAHIYVTKKAEAKKAINSALSAFRKGEG